MELSPSSLTNIVPVAQPLYVQAEDVQGGAIALATDGQAFYYLVVGGVGRPVWVPDASVENASLPAPARPDAPPDPGD